MTTARLLATERSPNGNLTRRVLVPRVQRPQLDRHFTPNLARQRDYLVLVRELFDDPLPFLQAPALDPVLSNPHENHLESHACRREPHQAVFQTRLMNHIPCGRHLLYLALVHRLRHYPRTHGRHHVIHHIWTLLNFVSPLRLHAVEPPLMPAGHRRVLRSGARLIRDTDHIGKRHLPHLPRHLLRPLCTHPRVPERP